MDYTSLFQLCLVVVFGLFALSSAQDYFYDEEPSDFGRGKLEIVPLPLARVRREGGIGEAPRYRRQGGGGEGVTGPVHTFVKTDEHAHFKWGVRHHVGHQFAGRR